MSKTESMIDGFEFADLEEAMKAAKEVEGVRFIRGKTDFENPEMVLQIYNKMVSQDMFETVVGYCYLKELQDYLYDSRVIADESVLPIKIKRFAAAKEPSVPVQPDGGKEKELPKAPGVPKVTENTQPRRIVKNTDYKVRSHMFGIVSVILAVCVVLMFIIVGTSGSPTILNYENQLIDKYEAWEQELQQREDAVKERERQFGQN